MFIYKITNHVNGKTYVGKTVKSIQERYQKHLYNHKTQNTYLYKAMRKYGVENFSIDIIEETPFLDEREIFWIETLNPEYNMTKGGEGGDTSKSPNFINSMKLYHQSKTKKSYATNGMLGKKLSKKSKDAISKANSCPVMCEGVMYASVGEAQNAYPGISIRKRLDSQKYTDFYRLKPKTKRV